MKRFIFLAIFLILTASVGGYIRNVKFNYSDGSDFPDYIRDFAARSFQDSSGNSVFPVWTHAKNIKIYGMSESSIDAIGTAVSEFNDLSNYNINILDVSSKIRPNIIIIEAGSDINHLYEDNYGVVGTIYENKNDYIDYLDSISNKYGDSACNFRVRVNPSDRSTITGAIFIISSSIHESMFNKCMYMGLLVAHGFELNYKSSVESILSNPSAYGFKPSDVQSIMKFSRITAPGILIDDLINGKFSFE